MPVRVHAFRESERARQGKCLRVREVWVVFGIRRVCVPRNLSLARRAIGKRIAHGPWQRHVGDLRVPCHVRHRRNRIERGNLHAVFRVLIDCRDHQQIAVHIRVGRTCAFNLCGQSVSQLAGKLGKRDGCDRRVGGFPVGGVCCFCTIAKPAHVHLRRIKVAHVAARRVRGACGTFELLTGNRHGNTQRHLSDGRGVHRLQMHVRGHGELEQRVSTVFIGYHTGCGAYFLPVIEHGPIDAAVTSSVRRHVCRAAIRARKRLGKRGSLLAVHPVFNRNGMVLRGRAFTCCKLARNRVRVPVRRARKLRGCAIDRSIRVLRHARTTRNPKFTDGHRVRFARFSALRNLSGGGVPPRDKLLRHIERLPRYLDLRRLRKQFARHRRVDAHRERRRHGHVVVHRLKRHIASWHGERKEGLPFLIGAERDALRLPLLERFGLKHVGLHVHRLANLRAGDLLPIHIIRSAIGHMQRVLGHGDADGVGIRCGFAGDLVARLRADNVGFNGMLHAFAFGALKGNGAVVDHVGRAVQRVANGFRVGIGAGQLKRLRAVVRAGRDRSLRRVERDHGSLDGERILAALLDPVRQHQRARYGIGARFPWVVVRRRPTHAQAALLAVGKRGVHVTRQISTLERRAVRNLNVVGFFHAVNMRQRSGVERERRTHHVVGNLGEHQVVARSFLFAIPDATRNAIGSIGVTQVKVSRGRVHGSPGRRVRRALARRLPRKRGCMLLVLVTASTGGRVKHVGHLRSKRFASFGLVKCIDNKLANSLLIMSYQLNIIPRHGKPHRAVFKVLVHRRHAAFEFPAIERRVLLRAFVCAKGHLTANARQQHRGGIVVFVVVRQVTVFRAVVPRGQINRHMKRAWILNLHGNGRRIAAAHHHLRARRHHEVLAQVDGSLCSVLGKFPNHSA